MLKNWLQKAEIFNLDDSHWLPWMIGRKIVRGPHSSRSLSKAKLAIIGIDPGASAEVRKKFYNLAWDFDHSKIVDLGDLRKSNSEFLIPILRELAAGSIVPLIIGHSREQFRAQYQSFQSVKSKVSVAMLDQRIRLKAEKSRVADGYSLNPAVHNRRQKLYHLSHLGSQRHLNDPKLYTLFDQKGYEYVRLGNLRKSTQAAEPILRDADLLGVDLSALQLSAAPAQTDASTAGLSVEEAATLCRYAGLSDKLQSFGIFGFERKASEEAVSQTADTAAQLIWYFCDGFANRYRDFPVTHKGLVEYLVDHPSYSNLTFWRSRKSGRWWVQSPAFKYKGEERHRLIACSQADYDAASRGQLPERLIAAFGRS
ncbi:MAG: hypothetical protein AAF741_13990 [Bacteroidota bacterium]